MSFDSLSIPPVNWPLFFFTSSIICLRAYIPLVCAWIFKKFSSSPTLIDELNIELKRLTSELKTISQQDEFAAYTRKERQRNALLERLKMEQNSIKTREKNFSSNVRMTLNITFILMMIFLTMIVPQHQSRPLFYFAFFRFPLIIWILALNTFVSATIDMCLRYRTNKETRDKLIQQR